MSGLRRRMAQGLVATVVLCALGFIICGSFASPGNEWEKACIVLVVVMLASVFSALVLVAATYLRLRADVRRHLSRPALSDAEFAAMLGDDRDVDPSLVGEIRALSARCFRRVGGERFHPADRLEDDLHLNDLAPFSTRAFCAGVEEIYGLEEDALRSRVAPGGVMTFGELVLTAVRLVEDTREDAESDGADRPGTVPWAAEGGPIG